jgi:hypothetical protein
MYECFTSATPKPVSLSQMSGGTTTVSPPNPVALAQWQKHKNLAKHFLTQCIPDSTVLHVWNLPDVVTMWNEIVHKYIKKGAYV